MKDFMFQESHLDFNIFDNNSVYLSRAIEKGFYSQTQGGGFLLNEKGCFVYTSPEFDIIIGTSPDNIIGQHISNFIGIEVYRDYIVKPAKNADAGDQGTSSFFCRWAGFDKSFTASINLYPPLEGSHCKAGLIKKVNMENAEMVLPTLTYLEQIIENIGCVMWFGTYDLSQIYYISPNFDKVYENTFEEYSQNSSSFWSRVHPEDLPRVLETYDPEKATTFNNLGFRYLMKNGEWVHKQVYRFFINDANGVPAMVAGIAIDDTELYNAQQALISQKEVLVAKNKELEHTNKLLEDFTALACHDLSQPLRIFTAYMQVLQNEYLKSPDERGQKLITGIYSAVNRMRGLIAGLADLSLLQESPHVDPIDDMESLIKSYISPLLSNEMTQEISLELSPLCPLKINKDHAIALFKNLIENAIKYNIKIPFIKIWCRKFKTGVAYAIQDNGTGIPKEAQNKIFSLGHRLPDAKIHQGSGIGLSACQKIMAIYKGHIWVHSKPGEGSTFYLFFPS